MSDGFHPPLEEYLETIHALNEEGVQVIQARLVERLGHSAQSVSEMVQRLASEGYLERSRQGLDAHAARDVSVPRASCASTGSPSASSSTSWGLPWHSAHVEAGRWEHVISDEVEARFVEILGNPSTCPHGNPIPGAPPVADGQRSLSEFGAGDRVRIARITEQIEIDLDSLRYLSEHGLVPGRTPGPREGARRHAHPRARRRRGRARPGDLPAALRRPA